MQTQNNPTRINSSVSDASPSIEDKVSEQVISLAIENSEKGITYRSVSKALSLREGQCAKSVLNLFRGNLLVRVERNGEYIYFPAGVDLSKASSVKRETSTNSSVDALHSVVSGLKSTAKKNKSKSSPEEKSISLEDLRDKEKLHMTFYKVNNWLHPREVGEIIGYNGKNIHVVCVRLLRRKLVRREKLWGLTANGGRMEQFYYKIDNEHLWSKYAKTPSRKVLDAFWEHVDTYLAEHPEITERVLETSDSKPDPKVKESPKVKPDPAAEKKTKFKAVEDHGMELDALGAYSIADIMDSKKYESLVESKEAFIEKLKSDMEMRTKKLKERIERVSSLDAQIKELMEQKARLEKGELIDD